MQNALLGLDLLIVPMKTNKTQQLLQVTHVYVYFHFYRTAEMMRVGPLNVHRLLHFRDEYSS